MAIPTLFAGGQLGLAVFKELRSFVSRGAFSFAAKSAQYVHNPPSPRPYSSFEADFEISAHHPRIGIGRQRFWFKLSFEHNGYDIRNAVIRVLRSRSNSMVSSNFAIQFEPVPASGAHEPITKLRWNIDGRWDPVGQGDVSLWGALAIDAQGRASLLVRSERNWVRHEGFSGVRRVRAEDPAARHLYRGAQPVRGLLRFGDRGPEVEYLQRTLNFRLGSAGRRLIDPHGVFGRATRRAVRWFQRTTGLREDGIVGPATWAQLTRGR